MKKTLNKVMRFVVSIAAGFILLSQIAMAQQSLEELANGDHRSESNKARNEFRNPVETLKFFGIKPEMTVVEISPGGGWYTEIIAPYLKDKGQYIGAAYDVDSKVKYYSNSAKKFAKKLSSQPELYSKAKTTVLQAPEKLNFAEENSADLVVSFRSAHGWARDKHADKVFSAIYKVVKPNGVFGLVQHRAGKQNPKDTSGKLGYLKQDEMIQLVKNAGFRLVERSEINANPKDTKDYKDGVWTLPPSYALKEKDREKYKAIGETDRMTLKFVKPAVK